MLFTIIYFITVTSYFKQTIVSGFYIYIVYITNCFNSSCQKRIIYNRSIYIYNQKKYFGFDLCIFSTFFPPGVLPYNKPGSSFAFSVTWHSGRSTTVWTGQCQLCDGKETLETAWLLRSYVDSCIDKWKSTLIGKNFGYFLHLYCSQRIM